MITITLKIKDQDNKASVEVTSKESTKVTNIEKNTAIVVDQKIKLALKELEKEGK